MKRISVRIPHWHYRRLLLEASARGFSISAAAEDKIRCGIEGNEDLINRIIQDVAQEQGSTAAEVIERWLRDRGYNPADTDE